MYFLFLRSWIRNYKLCQLRSKWQEKLIFKLTVIQLEIFFQFSNKVESVCIKQQDIGILENNANRKLPSCVVFLFVHIFVISPKWKIIWTLFLPLNVTMNVVKGKFIPRSFEIFYSWKFCQSFTRLFCCYCMFCE